MIKSPRANRRDPVLDAASAAIEMLVSECVANSIKHAFPKGQAGKVTLALCARGARSWLLECRDNGGGHGGQVSGADSTGPGKMRMTSAAEQLNGRLDADFGGSGAVMKLSFPR